MPAFHETTDAGDWFNTSYQISLGDSFHGEFLPRHQHDNKSDVDFVKFDMIIGHAYQFDLSAISNDEDALTPSIVLYDSTQDPLAWNHGDTARVIHIAGATATYYLALEDYFGEDGTYTLTVTEPELAPGIILETDDASNGIDTAYAFDIGETFWGVLRFTGDEDWVAIDLVAGQTYRFDIKVSGNLDSLDDPLLGLYDSTGTFLGKDNNGGDGLDSLMTFTATTTGTYYLSGGTHGAGNGFYKVTATEIGLMNGSTGTDLLTGGAASDTLHCLSGNDQVNGGGGNDKLFGNSGRDMLHGNKGQDRLFGGTGNDRLFGDNGEDRLFGGTGNDRLFGGNGKDRLRGGDGDDKLSGGRHNDILEGGAGNDLLRGGPGQDRFDFLIGGDNDRIIGFGDDVDTLRLDRDLWGGGKGKAAVIADFADIVGNDVVFDFENGDTITLVGFGPTGTAALLDDLVFI